MSGYPWRRLALCFLIVATDGMNVAIMGFPAPQIGRSSGLPSISSGLRARYQVFLGTSSLLLTAQARSDAACTVGADIGMNIAAHFNRTGSDAQMARLEFDLLPAVTHRPELPGGAVGGWRRRTLN